MQLPSASAATSTPNAPRDLMTTDAASAGGASADPRLAQYKIIRRNGAVVPFEPSKITIAMTKAFLAIAGGQGATSARVREQVANLTDVVVAALMKRKPEGGAIHIEEIQDQVELALMRGGEHEVARAYVLYREKRAQERAHEKARKGAPADAPELLVVDNGVTRPLDLARLTALVKTSCEGLGDVDPERVLKATLKDLYNGVPMEEVRKCVILAARTLIEKDPAYSFVTARLLLDSIRHEALGEEATHAEMATKYAEYFPQFMRHGVKIGLLNEALLQYDMKKLGAALNPERDLQFGYLGLQTLYDRYFLIDQYVGGRRFELPQCFFMRVAMGLALNEVEREARAIEFYDVLSTFDFMSSTPTLFNSGTHRSQLSSCYLTTVADDLDGIYEAIKENALLSKFAGGLGNDWTNVRAMGSHIKGTNGKSQGVVPFLKVVNDTAVAVNQCFAPETPVYTQRGILPIRQIRAGDLVLGNSGTYREVTEKLVYEQSEPMIAIDVKHSIQPLEVTDGHPFWAIRGVRADQSCEATELSLSAGNAKAEWADARTLQVGDYIGMTMPTETVNVDGFGEDDARLYGILLADGHLSKDGMQWSVAGNPERDRHLQFVRGYLSTRGVHFWETARGTAFVQLQWVLDQAVVRNATTGRASDVGATLPFGYDDVYDCDQRRRIAPRFAHLPQPQSRALLRGLLETSACVARGDELKFTTASAPLAEGVRYQLLRMGVAARGDRKISTVDVHIPAVREVAALVGCEPTAGRSWITHGGTIFSRIRAIEPILPKPLVVDLKVDTDESYMTAAGLAHNGGKRKGAVCTYLETWHLDIEEFLELRKNTGDDRRRTHDMNTANWIPDLFMKRVMEGGDWTLFSPSDVPDLHDKWGHAFNEAYERYEAKVARGELKLHKRIPAVQLWRKMLSMLFETGHPWITFKDACNVRSPQQHVGTVHSSNLCTEITLNTSDTEIAVCNLGSVNLLAHMKPTQGRLRTRPCEAARDDPHGDAHARQRHRHQLLRGQQGAQLESQAPAGRARRHGVPGLPAPAASAVRLGRVDEVRRRIDGSRLLLRVLGVDRARRGAWPLLLVSRQPVGSRHPSAGHAADAARRARRLRRHRHVVDDGLGRAALAHQDPRHAQLQLRGDRADGDDLEHHRRRRVDRAGVPEHLREVEPLRRVHRHQRASRRRAEEAQSVGRGDAVGSQVFRRLAREDRSRAGGASQSLRDGVRSRNEMDRRSRRAAAEVDRPGAEPQHLHGGRVGQEARRDVQARLGSRPQDDVLPAHARSDVGGEVDRQGRRAERGVVLRRGERGVVVVGLDHRVGTAERRCADRRGDQILLDRQPGLRSVSVNAGSRRSRGRRPHRRHPD